MQTAETADPTPAARRMLGAFFTRHLGRIDKGVVHACQDMPGFEFSPVSW